MRESEKTMLCIDGLKADKFWKRLRLEGDCLVWLGYCDDDGYGKLTINRKTFLAHRVAFEVYYGRKPHHQVQHLCNNPGCCDPLHLVEGTPNDNTSYRDACGRTATRERHGQAKLTEAQVKEILNSKDFYITLARRYKVSISTIGRTKQGKTWRRV